MMVHLFLFMNITYFQYMLVYLLIYFWNYNIFSFIFFLQILIYAHIFFQIHGLLFSLNVIVSIYVYV